MPSLHVPLSRGLVLAACAAAALAVAGAVAYASIPNAGGVLHACYNANAARSPGGSPLGVIDSDSTSCSAGRTEISWGQVGPAGATGPQGPSGPSGATGPSGTSHAFTVDNTKVINTSLAATEELVRLDGLPAGNYIVWGIVSDSDFGQDDVSCDLTENGNFLQVDPDSHFGVEIGNVGSSATQVAASAAPANTSIVLACGRAEGVIGGPPTISGRIVALQVDAIN